MLSRRSVRSSRRVPFALAALSLGFSAFAVAGPGCTKAAESTPPSSCASAANGLTCAPATCAMPGVATPGAPDTHCGGTIQPSSQAACDWDGGGPDPGVTTATTSGAGGGATGAGGGGTGGATAGAGGGVETSDYGPTQYGNESDDDDCKYHVTWTSTPICQNGGVTFTIKAINKATGMPLTGAAPYAEVYLDATHTSPNGPCACQTSATTEGPPGTYTIGPVFFDEPGKWTVRYHFFAECTDFSDESPHGHAAYYVTVN